MRLRIALVNGHPTYRYTIGGLKVKGRRRRLFFRTAAEAEAELRRLKIKTERSGQAGLDISDTLRVMAVDADRQLKPYGKTIADAVTHYMRHLAASESVDINTLIERYLVSQNRGGFTTSYLNGLRCQLAWFSADFGNRPCRTISTEDIEEWLYHGRDRRGENGSNHRLPIDRATIELRKDARRSDRAIGKIANTDHRTVGRARKRLEAGIITANSDKPAADQTLLNRRCILLGLFTWGLRQKCLETNPVAGVTVPKVVRKPPAIWKPEDLDRFLHAVPPEIIPSVAIAAFAGLRTAEVLRLEWSDIKFEPSLDFESGHIDVPALKAKTSQRRLVKIEPHLARWLEPFKANTGKVWAKGRVSLYLKTKTLSRLLGIKWPSNGLRHSFASYHLALFRNAAATAHEMGHRGTQMLFEHYREVVTPASAARYWQIVP